MWHLTIYDGDKKFMRLRLPASGLLIGSDRDCDVQLPEIEEPIRVVPSRSEVWVESGEDRSETLGDGESFPAGRFRVEIAVEKQESETAGEEIRKPTKTLVYNAQRRTLDFFDFLIQVTEGPDSPRSFEMSKESCIIGKAAACDLVLTDPYVSGRHVKIMLATEGCVVNDMGSRNGTFIDETRVSVANWRPGSELRIGRTRVKLELRKEHESIKPDETTSFAGMVGRSQAMRQVFSLIRRVAPTDATVLISGPTGSGKELVARALHSNSPRATGPFMPINCGAIVRELVASELFGHVRGAFTGATTDRKGVFEIAQSGTVFLDEVGELPLELQPNLLRVLEERRIFRVGDRRTIPVDTRVIAATNRDLGAEVKAGRFREDLFYRLDQIPIELPPLIERLEDLPLLVEHLLVREGRRMSRANLPDVSNETLEILQKHNWPGNVRELANVLSRALLLVGDRNMIEPCDLIIRPMIKAEGRFAGGNLPTLEEAERELIERAVSISSTRKAAAEMIGIASSTLYEKIKKYGLDDKE